jgi:peptidylprolyl isomerase
MVGNLNQGRIDMVQVQSGEKVAIHLRGRLRNGSEFFNSRSREPVEFVAGSTEMLAAISHGVLGMAIGEKKDLLVPPEDAFGDRDPEAEQYVRRQSLPEDVKVGDRLQADVGIRRITVWVREIDDDHALLDSNHPLAGEVVHFEIEVLRIMTSKERGPDHPPRQPDSPACQE